MRGIGTVKERAANTFKITLKHVSRASIDFDDANEDNVNSTSINVTSSAQVNHAAPHESAIHEEVAEEVPSSQTCRSFENLPTRNLLNYWRDKEREVLQSLKNVYKPRLHQLNVELRNPHLLPCDSDDKLSKNSSDQDASSDVSTRNSEVSPLMSENSIVDVHSRVSVDYLLEEVFESQSDPHESLQIPPSTVIHENSDIGQNHTIDNKLKQIEESVNSSLTTEKDDSSISQEHYQPTDIASMDPPSQSFQQNNTLSNDNVNIEIQTLPTDSTSLLKCTDNMNTADVIQHSEIEIKLNDSLLPLSDKIEFEEMSRKDNLFIPDSPSIPLVDSKEISVLPMEKSEIQEEPKLSTPDDSDTLSTMSVLSPVLDIINLQPVVPSSKEASDVITANNNECERNNKNNKKGGLKKRDPNRIKTVGAVRFEDPIEELEESEPLPQQVVIIEESQFPIPVQCIFMDVNPETNFIKEKLLGRGRFGQVYKCISRDSQQKFEVAGKFIRAGRSEIKKSVENEVKILQTLENHPQLVRFHSVYYMKREIAIFTELISGGELFERIANSSEETLTEPMVIKFVRQILKGIEYMHHKRIIHRDLKPENILCKTATSFEIKIIDFGFATFIEEGKAAPKQLAGTTVFMAPETIKFEPQGYYTDIWSVGVIAYNLLCGFTPFEKPPPNHPRPELTDQEILVNIEKGQYDFEDEEFCNTSKAAKDFINKLLQVSTKKRPSATECLQHEWFNERKIQRATQKVSRQVSLNRVRALIYLKKAVEVSSLKK